MISMEAYNEHFHCIGFAKNTLLNKINKDDKSINSHFQKTFTSLALLSCMFSCYNSNCSFWSMFDCVISFIHYGRERKCHCVSHNNSRKQLLAVWERKDTTSEWLCVCVCVCVPVCTTRGGSPVSTHTQREIGMDTGCRWSCYREQGKAKRKAAELELHYNHRY